MSIFSYYIPPGESKLNQAITNYLDSVGKFILMGDLNAKLRVFGPSNQLGKSLEEWLKVGKGFLINEVNMPTFFKFKTNNDQGTLTTEILEVLFTS